MSCPVCGYLFQPFEQDCPRCRRQQSRANAPAPAAPAAAPAAPVSSAPAPAAPRPVRGKRGNGVLLGLVAVLSIACIYLSGLVMGNYLAAEKAKQSSPYTGPSPQARPSPNIVVTPFQDPYAAQEQKDCATFVFCVQKLEMQRYDMAWGHQPNTLPGELPATPTTPRGTQRLPYPDMDFLLVRTEAERLRQMRQELE